jgi:hypothetical protein
MASPLLRFQTDDLSMWIILRNEGIRCETGFDSGNGAPFQVRWNWKIENDLCAFIAKSMDFSQ